jgi:hypothetical protein
MMLTTQLHLAPCLRMSGAVPPLCLHGVDMDNFTFYSPSVKNASHILKLIEYFMEKYSYELLILFVVCDVM